MKKVSCFLLLCVLFLNLTSIGYCANFVYSRFASNDYFVYFYDETSVKSVDYGIVDGWIKQVYTDAGREWVIQGYEKQLSMADEQKKTALQELVDHNKKTMYSKQHWQIDFKRGLLKVISSTDYDDSGRPVYHNDTPTEWTDIVPESSGEQIMYNFLFYLRINNKPIIE